MFFVAADHVHLKHGRRAVQWKKRMMDVVPASKQSLLFSCPGAQENAACWRDRPIAKCFGQLQKSGGPGTIIIRPVPDLAIGLAIVIVVRAYDHDLCLQ